MSYVVIVEGAEGSARALGTPEGTAFLSPQQAIEAAANLQFLGAEFAHVRPVEPCAITLTNRFVLLVRGGGKTEYFGPSAGRTWAKRLDAEAAALAMSPSGGAEPPDLQPVLSTFVHQVSQREAQALPINGMPE